MKVFVVGSHGYIARRTIQTLRDTKTYVVPVSSRPGAGELRLDLRWTQLFCYKEIVSGDVILMTAAISSPDVCRDRRDFALSVNVTGTSDFLSRCLDRGARIAFLSSDTVYGERTSYFDETANCNPAGEYAKMKHEVESRFLANPSFKSIRLSYVFSREDKFTKYLCGCVERGEEAEIFHPFYRSVVHRDDVVQGVIALASRWGEFPQSVINFGGPDVISRIEFAQAMKDSVLPTLRFRQIDPAEEFFANRPRIIRMKSPLLTSLLERPASSLRESAHLEFFDKGEQAND